MPVLDEGQAPYVGALEVASPGPWGRTAAVTAGDGRPLARVRWPRRLARSRFDVLDPLGTTVWGSLWREGSGPRHVFRLTDPTGQGLLTLRFGFFGPGMPGTATLPDGRVLSVRTVLARRRSAILDPSGAEVGRLIDPRRPGWTPTAIGAELDVPLLSLVQVVGLAEGMRAAEWSASA